MLGKFITVEGIEGAGKTTCIDSIKRLLRSHHIECISTREPGGTLLGEKVRSLLLDNDDDPPCGLTELLLIFSARAQHIEKVISPALSHGVWVLCDRFTDATFAYQGGGRGLKVELISQLELITQNGLRPDLTLLLDISPNLGLTRVKKRGNLDRFEREELEFFRSVRQAYLKLAKVYPERYVTIDASSPENKVAEEIRGTIINRFSIQQ